MPLIDKITVIIANRSISLPLFGVEANALIIAVVLHFMRQRRHGYTYFKDLSGCFLLFLIEFMN